MVIPGKQLEELLFSANNLALIVSPYIKEAALQRLLNKLPDKVTLKCITRWRPEEILSGVSDISIWKVISVRPNSTLWLMQNLHAKYYRADNRCLIGSANITSNALGWSLKPNIELLVELNASAPSLVGFEEILLNGCIEVNEDLYNYFLKIIVALEKEPIVLANAVTNAEILQTAINKSSTIRFSDWFPNTRHPENLYIAYNGALDELTFAAKESTIFDLNNLGYITPGLSINAFKLYVGSILLQHPLIRELDNFVIIPQRFGAVRDFLRIKCIEDSSRAWQTLMRWLLYFFNERYYVTVSNYSEIFGRKT